jgi:uncharacterized protein YunC (DUF1805 family)
MTISNTKLIAVHEGGRLISFAKSTQIHTICYVIGGVDATMIQMRPVFVDDKTFIAVHVSLPKTNLLSISCDAGYIMCGALDIRLLNEKLADRGIIAGRAVGVRTIEDLLEAKLESTTTEAWKNGIVAGMTGRQALLKMISMNRHI